MRVQSIGQCRLNTPLFPLPLEQVTLNAIRDVLPDSLILEACRDVGYRFRRRVLTPVVTVLHMLLAAIWPEESFQASADLLWDNGRAAGAVPDGQKMPSSGSFAKARGRLPLALWHRVCDAIAAKAEALSQAWASWRGHRVVLTDGTCLSMPAEGDLFAAFGRSSGRGGPRHYPLGRMVTLALANTMTVLAYALGAYRQSEQDLLRTILGRLREDDLLVADRHFAGANLYAEYRAAGVHFLTRAHQRVRVDRLRPVEVCGENDFVADLPVGAKYRREDPSLPKQVRVRLIQATVATRKHPRQTMWFVTSLLDAAAYPADEVVALYGRRWRIETLLEQVKVRLDADVLRSRTAEGVRKEVAARMTALNVIRCLMLEAALAHGQDPMRLSFAGAVRAILAFCPHMATAPPWKLSLLYAGMLETIAERVVPPRLGRQEPRAIRREQKHYPRLRVTRQQWRQQWAA